MTDPDVPDGRVDSTTATAEPRVLYVDPDRKTATSIVANLEAGTAVGTVHTARGVADGLSVVAEQPIDCIVSEYTLPDGDGIALLREVRDRYADLPFVLYTDEGAERFASRAIAADVSEYVSKGREDAASRLATAVDGTLRGRGDDSGLSGPDADEFRTLVEAVRDHAIFLLDPRGHVASWNAGAERIKGYSEGEILGEHVSTFFPDEAVEAGTPERLLARARTEGRVETQGRRVRKDGTAFPARVVITALRDDEGAIRGFAKFTRDLTEQRERERRIRRQHELTERILNAVPVGVAVHAPEGDLVRSNARAQDILETIEAGIDRAADESTDAGIYDDDGTPVAGDELPPRTVFETGSPVNDREIAIEEPDGSRTWLSLNAIPMYEPDGEEIERIVSAAKDVTALKERERQLRQTRRELEEAVDRLERTNHRLQVTEHRFDAFTENSSFAVVSMDESSTVQYANDTVEELFGYEPGELVGESLTRLMPDRLVGRHERAVERYLETGERRLDWEWVELPGKHRDGREIDLGLSFGETTVDGDHLFTGVIRDITEQKERERDLERYETIVSAAPDGVWVLDEDATILDGNETAAAMLGYEREELLGEPFPTLIEAGVFEPDIVDRYEAAVSDLLSSETDREQAKLEAEIRPVDGEDRIVEIHFTPLPFDETFRGTVGLIRDITGKKERRRELERHREELNELVAELERSNAELEQFAYAVSHDLKEPLRMVTSYLQLLERRFEDDIDDDAAEFIDRAVDGAARMQTMIDELLEYSRVSREESDRQPVDCTEVLDEVLESLPGAEAAVVDTDDLPTVAGNRTQIAKVFQNLVSNAITHSESGTVSIRVTATREGGQWRLSVADDGPGIPREQQDRVFDLFTSPGETGDTGIGLAICRKIVEHHGGDIRVESEPGEGATFSFTLPARDADARGS